jgi:hypothetical protein
MFMELPSFHVHNVLDGRPKGWAFAFQARVQNAMSYSQLRDVCLSVRMEQLGSHGTGL